MGDSTSETVAIEAGETRGYAPSAEIRPLIHTLRGEQVILDSDLAHLYGVETKVFNQAVKRNARRFPERFRFRLTEEEFDLLRSQSVTSESTAAEGTSRMPSRSRASPCSRRCCAVTPRSR